MLGIFSGRLNQNGLLNYVLGPLQCYFKCDLGQIPSPFQVPLVKSGVGSERRCGAFVVKNIEMVAIDLNLSFTTCWL